jgi:hypothetical protein
MWLSKDQFKNHHSSGIHNQKIKLPIVYQRLNTQIMVGTHNGMLHANGNEETPQMNFKNLKLKTQTPNIGGERGEEGREEWG